MHHAKVILIEPVTEISNEDYGRLRLKQREYFWIIKAEILAPKGLNKELNNA